MLSTIFTTVLALSAGLASAAPAPAPKVVPSPNDPTTLSRYLANLTNAGELPPSRRSVTAVPLDARGLGTATIGNRCNHDVWLWSVDQKFDSGRIRIPARSRYSETFRTPCEGCGIALKVSNTDQLLGGKQTQFEYAIKNNILYYDISFVDCAQGQGADNCPGHDRGVAIDSPVTACGPLHCAAGAFCPNDAYYVPDPLAQWGIQAPVHGCGGAGVGMEVFFKLCADDAPL
ncbi:hypothetical protein BDV96DRAFT_500527 [Lophiotrema nucula]|uniref:Uncharacterized protein n=1 Tax=Lophiotrema nucula TaxID=690887 RepID=A0A6A5YWT0_9PLEO|nr:hypothetical protein BDV96DRAFT_500527 [Lophiotrema nucula]